PDPRMVLRTGELHVPRSLRKTLRQGRYRFTMDSAFPAVIGACAAAPRHGQRGTWITPQMRSAYLALHRLGWAHSVEAWRDEALAGGVYGVSLGAIFFGESMFARAPDASKAAFVALAEQLHGWGITLIDCQVYTPHLARFGAREWPRRAYVAALERALAKPTRRGHWAFDGPAVPDRTRAAAR
ncbi:MAG: leucyl/phenylalanyl-tRNA--protein transferase, partial [Candidatus Rokuibacteriota bacterium]